MPLVALEEKEGEETKKKKEARPFLPFSPKRKEERGEELLDLNFVIRGGRGGKGPVTFCIRRTGPTEKESLRFIHSFNQDRNLPKRRKKKVRKGEYEGLLGGKKDEPSYLFRIRLKGPRERGGDLIIPLEIRKSARAEIYGTHFSVKLHGQEREQIEEENRYYFLHLRGEE